MRRVRVVTGPVLHAVRRYFTIASMQTKLWWVYLLACKGGRTYAGIAIDVDARFLAHREGKGAKFTRANPPLKILGAQSFPTRSDALKAEYALKRLERPQKLAWSKQWKWSAPKLVVTRKSGHS